MPGVLATVQWVDHRTHIPGQELWKQVGEQKINAQTSGKRGYGEVLIIVLIIVTFIKNGNAAPTPQCPICDYDDISNTVQMHFIYINPQKHACFIILKIKSQHQSAVENRK